MIQDGKSNNLHWVEARGGALPHAAIKVTLRFLQKIIFYLSNNLYFILQKMIFCIFQKTGHERNGDPLFVARAKVAGGHWAVGGFLQFLVFTFGWNSFSRETQSEDGVCSSAVWRQGEYSSDLFPTRPSSYLFPAHFEVKNITLKSANKKYNCFPCNKTS